MKGYMHKSFNAPGSLLKDLKIEPEADILTKFFSGLFFFNDTATTDTYTLRDGRVIKIHTRWTGTAINEDGKWKVLNAHIGLNILDNPILDAVEQLRWVWGAGGILIGLVVGVLGTLLLKRRKA